MAYARFDDRYDDHRKIKRAIRREPASIALHAMAITYCCRHESDGVIDAMQVEDWLAVLPYKPAQKAKVMATLLELELFEQVDDERFRVHNFLKWNDSSAHRARLRDAGRRGAQARWAKGGDDSPPIADGIADGNGGAIAEANGPPHHTTPTPTPTPFPPGPPPGVEEVGTLAAARRLRARDDEQAVFDAWIAATRRTPKTLFDDKRRRSIRKGLDLAGLDACLAAVRGIGRSEHHTRNPQWTELHVALRDASHIENLGALDGPDVSRPSAADIHAAYRSAGGTS